MASCKFENMPQEVHIMIFKELFKDSTVIRDGILPGSRAIGPIISLLPRAAATVLRTSRLISQRAKPALASCITLVCMTNHLNLVPEVVQKFYFPLIRKTEAAFCPQEPYDFSVFTGLQCVDVTPMKPFKGLDTVLLPEVQYESAAKKITFGGLDDKVVRTARCAISETEGWTQAFFSNPNHTYKTLTRISARWAEGELLAEQTFDLRFYFDTLQVISRRLFSSDTIMRWKGQWCSIHIQPGTPYDPHLDTRVAWDREDYDPIKQDPETTCLELTIDT